jgi:hypothetical protein
VDTTEIYSEKGLKIDRRKRNRLGDLEISNQDTESLIIMEGEGGRELYIEEIERTLENLTWNTCGISRTTINISVLFASHTKTA